MIKKGSQLEFISWINRDGSGTSKISLEYIELMYDERFSILRLSVTEKTFIAHNLNSFVVRIK